MIVSPAATGPVGEFSLTIPSDGPIAVSTWLLAIGARSGLVESSVPVLVTVEPPPAVTVTSNEKVVVPG